MPSSNTETLAGLAREVYPVSEIQKLEQLLATFLSEIEEGEGLDFSPTEGGSFKFPVKAYGPHGQKMMNEQEALPTARASNVVQGRSFVKEYVGILQFTKRELELARSAPQAFANAKTFEMEGLIENAVKYENRQVANGDGSGLITLVNGAQIAGETDIEVDDATPFQIGMVIDIWDAAGTSKTMDSVVITDINILSSPNVITIDTAVPVGGVADNSQIYLASVHDNASTDGKEMIGLPLVTDDGTLSASFQDIVRTGVGEVPNYRGITLDALSSPISVALINQLMTRALRVGGTDFTKRKDVYHLVSPEQWRAYASLAVPLTRFMVSDSPDGNKQFGEFECMGKRVVLDTDVSRTRWTVLTKKAVNMATAAQLDWESDLGGTSLKWLSGYTQGVMILYGLKQMFSQNPREAAAITNLQAVSI